MNDNFVELGMSFVQSHCRKKVPYPQVGMAKTLRVLNKKRSGGRKNLSVPARNKSTERTTAGLETDGMVWELKSSRERSDRN